jgi:hypothetical protein
VRQLKIVSFSFVPQHILSFSPFSSNAGTGAGVFQVRAPYFALPIELESLIIAERANLSTFWLFCPSEFCGSAEVILKYFHKPLLECWYNNGLDISII